MLPVLFKVLVLACVAALALGGAHSSPKVSASIRDTTVSGLEGFNVNVVAPFRFQDYVLGFRYALGDLKKLPESFFVRRSFDTPADGTATIDADYHVNEKALAVDATWESAKHGVAVNVRGDTVRKLSHVEVSKSLPLKANRLSLTGAYNVVRKSFQGAASLFADQTVVRLEYDSEDQNPSLSVTRTLDDANEITPSICLRTGDMTYAYARKWVGGSLRGKLFPGEQLELSWNDAGANGVWCTTARIPIKDVSNTKVSIAHEWNY